MYKWTYTVQTCVIQGSTVVHLCKSTYVLWLLQLVSLVIFFVMIAKKIVLQDNHLLNSKL